MVKKKIIKIFLHIVVIVLFMHLILNTNFKELMREVKKIEIHILLFVVLLQLLTQYLLVVQWHRITKNVLGKSSMKKMAYIFTKGTVIEAITPGAKIGGEATRYYYMKKIFGCNTEKSVTIILIQKCISMSVLMLVCIGCLLKISIHMRRFMALPLQLLLAAIFLITVVAMVYSLCFSRQIVKFLERFDNKIINKIKKYLNSYSDTLSNIGRKEWMIQFLISTTVWLLFPVKMLILAHTFGVQLDFDITIAITMTSYMMGMLPITPGGLGTFEGTMVALLALFSIKNRVSIAITVIFRFVTFWLVILGSFIYSVAYEFIERGRCIVKK